MKRSIVSKSTTVFLWVVGNSSGLGFGTVATAVLKKIPSKHIAWDNAQGWLVWCGQAKVHRRPSVHVCLIISLTLHAQHRKSVGFPVSVPKILNPSSPLDKTFAVARPCGKKCCGLDTELGRNS